MAADSYHLIGVRPEHIAEFLVNHIVHRNNVGSTKILQEIRIVIRGMKKIVLPLGQTILRHQFVQRINDSAFSSEFG